MGSTSENGGGAVRVSSNDVSANVRGVFVVGASRAVIDRNRIGNSSQRDIEIDAGSSGTLHVANTIDTSGTVIDDGPGNCWKNDSATPGVHVSA
jgi:hypothetical protein